MKEKLAAFVGTSVRIVYLGVVTVIGEILAGKALDVVLRGGKEAVDGLLKLNPPKQLLAIIDEQYGEQTGLSRKDFFAWLEVDELGDAILATLGGDLIDGKGGLLEELVAQQLHDLALEERGELAGEIASSIVRLAPWVQQELGDGISHLSHKMDRQHERMLEAVGARPESSGGPSSAAEALLRGPLVQIGREDDARRAQQLANSGKPHAAADLFMGIVAALREAALGVAADTYLGLAGELYAEAGEAEAAATAISQAAEAQVRRGSSQARLTVGKLREVLSAEREWQADALEARIGFPEDLAGALEALRVAAERTRRDKGHLEHLANYCDLLAFASEFDTVLKVTADLSLAEPADEAELRLSLNRLDALDAANSYDEEADWDDLLLALDRGDEPVWAGLAWQRRGASFARAGQVDRSQDAYRRAMAAFSRAPGYQEQAADAFYSLQLAVIMNVAGWPEMELRALAYEQRGSPEAPVARAGRLARQGMDHRIAGKLPDAFHDYSLALEMHRRSGSLQGQLEVSEKLGELLLQASRPTMAMGFYIAAGKSKEAAAAAKTAPSSDIAGALRAGGSRWERDATLAVIAEAGERLPPQFLAEVGPWIIAEAKQDPDGCHAPQPAYQARRALAAVLLGLPDDQREPALSRVLTDLKEGRFDIARTASHSLVYATSVGLTDATESLVESFLTDPYNSRISIEFLAERVKEDDSARHAIEAAAVDSGPALAVLSLADLIAGNGVLEKAADRAAKSLSEAVNVKRTERGVSVGGGRNVAQEAIAAESASEDARAAAVERMLAIANDPADSELNRHAAANALFNFGDAIPARQASAVVEGLAPAAKGEYPLSQWDQNVDDPLSRVQINMHTPAVLQGAAIGAVGRVLRTYPDLSREPLVEAARVAYQRGPDSVIAAATDALAQVTDLDLPVPIEALLCHRDSAVRLAALRCWQARNDGLPSEDIVAGLTADASLAVRHNLLVLAVESGEWSLVEQFAESDEHALIRRLAEQRLKEIRASSV